jgi:hypothetical protein
MRGVMWRYVFLTPECVSWIMGPLRSIPKSDTAQSTPPGQLEAKLTRFCEGSRLSIQDMHIMLPHKHGVWEVKTVDVRVFGWFPVPNYLILHTGGDAQKLHDDLTLYNPLINDTASYRDNLPPGLPGPIMSKRQEDVISNRI